MPAVIAAASRHAPAAAAFAATRSAAVSPLLVGAAGSALAAPVVTGAVVAIQTPAPSGPGAVRYSARADMPAIEIAPRQRTPLAFTIDPNLTLDLLNPPFAGHDFFDGTTIRPRAYGDGLDLLINLFLRAAIADGQAKFDVDVGSPAGPTGADTEALFADAGDGERATGRLALLTLANFLANGARLFITTKVPLTIQSITLTILPRFAWTGTPP